MKLIRFMLALCDAVGQAESTMLTAHDYHGRPRLPFVIDPSCGTGSFLIEYMKLITGRLRRPELSEGLPGRIRDAYEGWFGARKNAWAKEYIFGIENNYDLGLAAKVNMVLHGDGSMNTWIHSGLLAFSTYWLEGRNNILGTGHRNEDGLYDSETNGQFDLVVSNPPFSLKMSPDEKREVQKAFTSLAGALSERIFIERWYQLLRDGGVFCCVLPEAILDTPTNIDTRLFLYQFFRIRAVVSLPYDTFRPFTSTKTCIVLAEKRSQEEAKEWEDTWATTALSKAGASKQEVFREVISKVGWSEDPIFMAEPVSVGYKRRKGLPDLRVTNDLYSELPDGTMDSDVRARCVLHSFLSERELQPCSRLGFWTKLGNVGEREHLRLDPKYRWLWDYQKGVVHGVQEFSQPLGNILEIANLPSVPKGGLVTETKLIDLECVESRQGLLRDPPLVDSIGSQRIRFDGCQLAISKLEPYLGKVLLSPPPNALGSTEWVGLNCISDLPLEYVAYLLMLPGLCEAYRRLQSGKRHARFDPREFLDLRVQLPDSSEIGQIQRQISEGRERIVSLRIAEAAERESIDALLGMVSSRDSWGNVRWLGDCLFLRLLAKISLTSVYYGVPFCPSIGRTANDQNADMP